LSYNRNQYDETHPIFNKTREEKVWGGFALLTLFNPFGLEHWSVTGGLDISATKPISTSLMPPRPSQ
jgi:hypothetical protein